MGRPTRTFKEGYVVHEDSLAIGHLGGSGSYPIASPWCSLYFLSTADEGKGKVQGFWNTI